MKKAISIAVESTKRFDHGFILDEAEFRRLNDSINDQFSKLENSDSISARFTLTYENGVIATYETIDDVFLEENSGSSKIIRVAIDYKITKRNEEANLDVIFINIDSDKAVGDTPIKYIITGKSRDWVFITGSLLNERINKIRRMRFQLHKTGKNARFLTSLLIPISMLFGTFLSLFTVSTKKIEYITELRNSWKNGEFKDSIDFMLKLEEKKRSLDSPLEIFLPMIIILISVTLFFIFYFIFDKLYPRYNFKWGDYIKEFEKIEKWRGFFLIGLLFTLAISIIGSILGNILTPFFK